MKEAAILIPIYRHAEGDLRMVLIRRSEGGVNGGQLAFPGGKAEPHDASLLDTALRETEEEIGLARAAVTILAHLPITETRTTGFRIHPFLGHISPPARWQPNIHEVAEVLTFSLTDLAHPAAHTEGLMDFPTWPAPRLTPFYQVGPYRIWGATYRILHPLLPRLVAGEWAV